MPRLIQFLEHLASGIDCFTEWTGRLVAWLTLAMMLLTCLVVVMRYFLQSGSIALSHPGMYSDTAVLLGVRHKQLGNKGGLQGGERSAVGLSVKNPVNPDADHPAVAGYRGSDQKPAIFLWVEPSTHH